jgi:hypothetical protein
LAAVMAMTINIITAATFISPLKKWRSAWG